MEDVTHQMMLHNTQEEDMRTEHSNMDDMTLLEVGAKL